MVDVTLAVYILLGAVVGIIYILRRVIRMERRIIEMEKRIIKLDKNILTLVKKRRR